MSASVAITSGLPAFVTPNTWTLKAPILRVSFEEGEVLSCWSVGWCCWGSSVVSDWTMLEAISVLMSSTQPRENEIRMMKAKSWSFMFLGS